MRDELLQQAKFVAQGLNNGKIDTLSGTEEDLKKPEYYQLKEQLANIKSVNDKCRFVYLMYQKPDGKVFFLADSEPVGSADESPSGQIYEDVDEGTLTVFRTATPTTTGPAKDEWGTWISSYAPLFKAEGNSATMSEPQMAKKMVEEAVEYYRQNGKQKLLDEVNNKSAAFFKDSIYVFVLNKDIKMLAHPLKSELVNNDFSNWKDYSGSKYLGKEMQQVALLNGNGWVDYLWENPVNKKVSEKTTFVQQADDLIICAGAYKSKVIDSAVLGMDIDASVWYFDVFVRSLYSMGFILIIATLIVIVLLAKKRQKNSDNKPIFWQLMLPIGTAMVILIAIFSVVLLQNERKDIQIKESRHISQIQSEIKSYINRESFNLAATLEAIVNNEVVAKAVKNKDKQELISNCLPLFKNLKQDYGITNLYFFGTDMVYITRIHKTDQDGDVINNWTATQVAKTGKYAIGVELAPLGVLAIRAAQPVFYEQEIVGYAAIGKDISDLITNLKSKMNVDSALIVDKKYLNREKWQIGLDFIGRSGNWDMLQDSVLLYSSMPTLPDQLKDILDSKQSRNKEIDVLGKTLRILNVPFNDASGKQIGRLFITDDITEQKTSFIAMTSIAGFFILIIVGWTLGFLYILLKRTDQRIIRDKETIEQAKSRYDNLATQSRTIMWQVDNNGLYTYISDVIEDVLGYKPSEIIGKKYFYDFHPENGREQFKAAAFEVFKQVGSFADLENLAQAKDGRLVWLNTNGMPAFDKDGNLIGYNGSDTDITDKKRAEQALLDEQENLKSIWEKTPFGVAIIDKTRTIRWTNPAVCKMAGVESLDDIIGKQCGECLCPAQQNECPVMDKGQSVDNSERILKRKDGRQIPILKTVKEFNYFGEETYLETFIDITDRKQAEQKLKESHEQYMLAVNGSNDGIWDWDIANNKIYLSPKWKEMIGYKDDELPNCLETFSERLHPDEKQVVMDYLKDYLRRKISVYHIELRFRHKDGSYIWILAKGEALRDEKGFAYRMAGSHTDITARKSVELAEEARFERTHRQQSALIKLANNEFINTGNMNQAIPFITEVCGKALQVNAAGIWLFSQDDSQINCADLYSAPRDEHQIIPPMNSSNFTKYTNYLSQNKVLPIEDVLTDQRAEEFRDLYFIPNKVNSTLDAAIYISDKLLGVICFEHTDGIRQWQQDEINFASAVADQISRLIVNMERRMAEEKLRYAMEMANAATKAKSEFLANMSHEIRTPMNAIIGFSDLLAEEQLTQTQKDYLETIRNSGKNLLTLINDILDFSKIEAGKLQTEIAECNLNGIMHHIDSLMRPMAINKNLDFQVLQCGTLPAKMKTDSTRLTQCLINLVNNAIKFTDTGHIYVNVSQILQNGAPFVVFDVEDTGIGIPENRQAAVFESFTQVDGSTTRKYGGTGLGLTITRQLAEILGGSISLKSQQGKGSTFTIKLPVGIAAEDNQYADKYEFVNDLNKPEENKPEQLKFDAKVLVAEDNPSNQMLIKILLSKLGLQIDIADDGLKAIDFVSKNSYDLILMDMQMPNLNGYEATVELRKMNITIPIVALTANAMKDDEQKCIDCGCNGYISKPLDKKKLPQQIAEFISPLKFNTMENTKNGIDNIIGMCQLASKKNLK